MEKDVPHYYVVCRADPTGLYVLDGNILERQRIKPSSVGDVLTGYALIQKTTSVLPSARMIVIMLSIANLFLVRTLLKAYRVL
jgi:hypothetical protein